jgi:hypothetical protein
VLRACPAYSSGAGGVAAPTKLTVIGRNFRDSAVLTCRFAACGGSDAGPLRCRTLSGDDAGTTSTKTIEVRTAMRTDHTISAQQCSTYAVFAKVFQNHCNSRHSASLAEQTLLTDSAY